MLHEAYSNIKYKGSFGDPILILCESATAKVNASELNLESKGQEETQVMTLKWSETAWVRCSNSMRC